MQIKELYESKILLNGISAASLKAITKRQFELLKESEELYECDINSSCYDIDHIFNSIYEQNPDGYLNLKVWRHVDTSEIINNWMKYGVARDELIESAIQYLDDENKWAHSKELDWLYVDLLMFAEYIGTISETYKYRFNTIKYYELYKSNKNIPNSIKFKERLLGLLWLTVFIGFLFFYYPLAIVIATVFLIRLAIRIYFINELTKAYVNAGIAYDSILTGDWKIVWEDLNHSRRKGVIWDKSVFEIVQRNI